MPSSPSSRSALRRRKPTDLSRFFKIAFAVFALSAIAAGVVGGTHPALAASKPTASPEPSGTAVPTPEPPDVAIPRLQAKLKVNPNDTQSLTEITGYYLQINRPDFALQSAQKLLQLGVKTGQVYYFSGYSNMLLGRIPQATSDLENASNLEPTNLNILSTLADLYIRQQRPADAERVAKRALTFNKDDKRAYMTYGQVLASEGKFDDARAQYEAAAKLDPKDPSPILLEAQTYIKQNAVALALSLFDRALTIDPNNLDALYGKAQILAQEHNVKDSIATYEQIYKLQTDPNDKVAVIDQEAVVYANEKMDSDADSTFKRAISEFPNVLSAHTAYGDYLISKNDKAGAEREFTAGVGPNRDQIDALARLGQLYAGQSQYPKAIDQFRRVAELAPNDPRSHLLLGATYSANRQFDKAGAEFKASYQLQHTPDALLGLGQADLATHNYNECAQVYDALDKGAPDLSRKNPSILYGLGQCYQGQRQPDKAKAAYVKLLGYVPAGSQAASELRQLIAQIDRKPTKPATKATPAPKKSS